MGEIISLTDRRRAQAKTAQKQHTGAPVTLLKSDKDFDERIERIKGSIARINALMAELRSTASTETVD
jgi:hypothetical protein